MSRSGTLLVFLFLAICVGIVRATAEAPEREPVDLSGRRWPPLPPWWAGPWWHPHPNPPPHVPSTRQHHHHHHHHTHNKARPLPPTPIDNASPPLPPPSPSTPVNNTSPPPPPTSAGYTTPPPPPVSSASPPPVVSSPLPPLGDESSDCSLVLINVDGCISDLITSFFKDDVSLTTECCKAVSRISDDCFDIAFTHFRAPIFQRKVRNYCLHQT